VKREAEAAGLSEIQAAGGEWREAGCLMHRDERRPATPGQYAVSTSNRNSRAARAGGRTFLPAADRRGQPSTAS
jgi:homoaconitase/3-isopropylmalate dehydratase large subunit